MIRRALLAVLALLVAGPLAAQTPTFIEAATAETQDFTRWAFASGTVTSTSTGARNNSRTIQVGTGFSALRSLDGSLTSSSYRLSMWVQFASLASDSQFYNAANAGGSTDVQPGLCLNSANGHIYAFNTAGACSAGSDTGASVSASTWYRVSIAATGSATNVRVYSTDGSTLLGSTSTADTGSTASSLLLICGSSTGNCLFSDVYADNSNAGTDPGNISVTPKRPASNNTNNFEANIGLNPANRWTNVNERPLNGGNGWQQASQTQVRENYGIDAASGGDVDISSGKTIVGYGGWIYASAGDTATTPTVTAVNASTTGAATNASGSCAAKATGTTCVTGSFSASKGDLCIAAFADQMGSTAPTIASSPASTWNALSGPTTSTVRLSWWYSVISTGNSTATVTFTFPSSALARAGAVTCFNAGATATTPLDKNPVNLADATSPYNGTATGALTQANEWVVGAFAWAGPSTDTVAASAPFSAASGTGIGTSGGTVTANVHIFLEYESVSATTTQTTAATDSTANRAGVVGSVSFKRSGFSNGGGTPAITVNGADTTLSITNVAVFSAYAASASYPSGAFGMLSTGQAPTYLFEGGVVVAYKPSTGSVTPMRMPLLGVRDAPPDK
jgi:hypothetical protein